MPVLKDFRQTKRITLPSFEGSEVEIYNSLLVRDMVGMDFNEENKVKMGMERLPLFIKSWNFTDEADKALDVNLANLGFLREADITHLIGEIQRFEEESKKK